MNVLFQLVSALWHQDFVVLANVQMIWGIYSLMFAVILLENALLPAAFLPGDSLLILAGAMVAKGVMAFIPALIILTAASGLGYWLGYLQGRWLGNTRLVQRWLAYLPPQYFLRATTLFQKHGFSALLLGRFLAYIRTLLPALAGMSDLKPLRFQLMNWLSGLLWVLSMLGLGWGVNQVPAIRQHQDLLLTLLMVLPMLLLFTGLLGFLLPLWKKRQTDKR